MKAMQFCLLALVCLAGASPALAQPRVGNGGGVWTCEERSGRIRWLRFVDLFEAENEFGLTVKEEVLGPWAILSQKRALLARVSPALHELLEAHPVNFQKVIKFIPKDTGLSVIEDAAIRVRPLPVSCEGGYLYYGQLANFTEDGRLLISSRFWADEAFTDTERGALLLHEAIYKALREGSGDRNSSRVRQIVGALFSELPESELARIVERVLGQPVPRE